MTMIGEVPSASTAALEPGDDIALREELELHSLACSELGIVLQEGGIVSEGDVVVSYFVQGWRRDGVYGMTLEGKDIQATVISPGAHNGDKRRPLAVPVRFKHENFMSPQVVAHLNTLADKSRPASRSTINVDHL